MKVLLGTTNPLKIEALDKALKEYFDDYEIISIDAPSSVSDMPFNDEVVRGAKNRAEYLKKYAKDNGLVVDYYVSLEGGIHSYFGDYVMTNIAYIEDSNSKNSIGTSGSFPIPNEYIDEIKVDTMGSVIDKYFNQENVRYTIGAVGVLTRGKFKRLDEFYEAYMMALVRFINDKW